MEPVIRAHTSHFELPRLAPLALGVLLLGAQSEAQALGVGRPLTLSALGQPLNLVFPVQLSGDESLSPDCARAEVIAGESRVPPSLVQVQLEGESDTTVRAVRVQSLVQIDEPLVTVSLSLGCPSRFTRQFTAFIDPPSLRPELAQQAPLPEPTVKNYSPQLRAALSTAEAKPAQLLAQPAQPAPQLAQLPNEAASAPTPSPAPKPPRRPTRPVETTVAAAGSPEAASAPERPASSAKPTSPKPARKQPPATVANAAPEPAAKPAAVARPRLQLEPPEALDTLQAAASAPLPAASVAVPDPESDRIKRLEESLQRMQAQNRETSDKLSLLRGQLEQEHSARFQNPVVYVLAVLLAGLAAFCVYLWRARARDRAMHEAAWWEDAREQLPHSRRVTREPETMGMAGVSVPMPLEDDEIPTIARSTPAVATPSLAERVSAELDQTDLLRAVETPEEDNGGHSTVAIPQLGDFVSDSMLMPASPAIRGGFAGEPLSVQLVEQTQPLDIRAVRPAAPLSVSTLVDLEQQAEFFMLLGQDDAAIELLSGKLQGASSPWPYLLLLEVYQRQGDMAAFELVGETYAHQFNVAPPAWEMPLGDGPGLAACPELLHTLQKIWIDNAASMDYLRGMLVRDGEWQGGRVELPAEVLHDLALMRDMLSLFLVARDLAEHPARSAAEAVDLILPLDGGGDLGGLDLDLTSDTTSQ
ncbi:hypothetical protein [Pelomonas sp. SE-A7]|uniref:type IV pilus assembly protein FimV n=1 Tax=Pelomonas sp. SE-A7 TaxID=3054953 RepID=UPI00259D2600|nr:hypothetical protein [Pelomonas sp. SE-A7]MDM4764849.1 hypothetical protein [Pelomonas sp. SE-A7]